MPRLARLTTFLLPRVGGSLQSSVLVALVDMQILTFGSSYLRASLAESPFAQAYDDPLTPDMVHTMAHGFIISCPPNNPAFPIKPFPSLAVTTSGTISSGQTIGLQTVGYTLAPSETAAHLFAAFITVTGPDWVRISIVEPLWA